MQAILNYSNHTIPCVHLILIQQQKRAHTHTRTEPMWLWFGYKRIDSQRNNKQKNNGLMSLVSLLLLAYRIQWHWYVIVLWRLVLITSPNALGACVSQSVCHLQWSVNLPYNNENVYISREREKKKLNILVISIANIKGIIYLFAKHGNIYGLCLIPGILNNFASAQRMCSS